MGRIRLQGDSHSVARADNGHITDGMTKFETGIRGNPIWFIIDIDQVEKYHSITLEASFDYEPSAQNPDERRHLSKIGIWTAVKDTPSVITQTSRSGRYPHAESKNFSIHLDDWKFGRESQIGFEVTESSPYGKIQLALCAMPYFLARDLDAKTKAEIRLKGIKKGELQPIIVDTKTISFSLDEKADRVPEHVIMDLFNEFGAFNIDGKGNSIHPKQLYTAMALKQQLGQHKGSQVDIAYIGTDTTENIRSLIRRMKDDDALKGIRNFFVYYLEGWDTTLIKKYPGLKLDAETSDLKDKLKLIKIPKDGGQPEDVKPVDYTISTYVTPWAVADDKNKLQYTTLIQSLLAKKDAKLISVDPEDSSKVIRDYCDVFNLHDTYTNEMGLISVGELGDSSNVIDCTIWENKNEVGE